jgi:small subunit ribosomal protein S4
MGDTKKPKKKYARPRKPWDKNRLEAEAKVKEQFGLRNKREMRLAEAAVRAKRQNARQLLALPAEKRAIVQQELIASISRIGLLTKTATLDDVLALSPPEMLERRLQTQVMRKGLATTMKQARQFITHGHIAVAGHKVTSPGYIVAKAEESTIAYYGKPLKLDAPEPKGKTKKIFEEALPSDATPIEEPVVVADAPEGETDG